MYKILYFYIVVAKRSNVVKSAFTLYQENIPAISNLDYPVSISLEEKLTIHN